MSRRTCNSSHVKQPASGWSNDLQDWEEGDGDFVAPELLHAGAHAEPSADVFSFGATLYVLATGTARSGPLQFATDSQ